MLFVIISLKAFSLEQNRKPQIKAKQRMTVEQVAFTLEKAGFPREIVPVVTCLALYESGFKPTAININNNNNTKDHGLLQINDIWKEECNLNDKDLTNPLKNSKCALKVYNKQGLTAWVTYKKFKRICLAYKVPNYNTIKIAEIIIKNNSLM